MGRPRDPSLPPPPPVGGLGDARQREGARFTLPSRRATSGMLTGRTGPGPGRHGGAAGLERRPPVGTAPHSGARARNADQEKARGRLGTPTSGRHRCAQRSESAQRRSGKSAGTAWNADLRSAPPRAAGRDRVLLTIPVAPPAGNAGLQTGTARRRQARDAVWIARMALTPEFPTMEDMPAAAHPVRRSAT